MIGAFITLFLGPLFGLETLSMSAHPVALPLTLFSLIGILLLFGLVTKNSILLVDYANQLRAEGTEKVEAMRSAAPIRMRPVLMTALSMIFGALPAAIGVGPGAENRAPMALATVAGMFSSTLLTLLVVPVFYLVLDDLAELVKRNTRGLLGRPAVSTRSSTSSSGRVVAGKAPLPARRSPASPRDLPRESV